MFLIVMSYSWIFHRWIFRNLIETCLSNLVIGPTVKLFILTKSRFSVSINFSFFFLPTSYVLYISVLYVSDFPSFFPLVYILEISVSFRIFRFAWFVQYLYRLQIIFIFTFLFLNIFIWNFFLSFQWHYWPSYLIGHPSVRPLNIETGVKLTNLSNVLLVL